MVVVVASCKSCLTIIVADCYACRFVLVWMDGCTGTRRGMQERIVVVAVMRYIVGAHLLSLVPHFQQSKSFGDRNHRNHRGLIHSTGISAKDSNEYRSAASLDVVVFLRNTTQATRQDKQQAKQEHHPISPRSDLFASIAGSTFWYVDHNLVLVSC
jgi:hypothetical protein